MAGLLLTIDGFEYALGTGGIATLPTSADADFPDDTTLIPGALMWPKQSITERCRPLDGDVDVSGLNFDVRDMVPSTGSAAGHRVFTYLGTRGTLALTNTLLDDALTEGETSAITVLSSLSFAASGDIWIDQEAIGYTSKSSGTKFDGLTRGKYGSRARAHVYEPSFSYASVVYASFPGFEGRRCVLWLVDNSNVATCLWIGRIRNGPRSSGSGPAEGIMYQFQCDHVWQSERELRLGADAATCNLSGYDPSEIAAQITYSGAPFISSSIARATTPMCSTLSAALNVVRTALQRTINTLGADVTVDSLSVTGSGITFDATTNVGQASTAILYVGRQNVSSPAPESSDRRHPSVSFAPIPIALAKVTAGAASTLPIDDASKLPSSWSNVTTSTSPHTTSVRYVLVGDYDKDLMFVFEPSGADTSVTPHTVTGYGFLVPLSRDAIGLANAGTIHLDRDIQLRAVPRVSTTHWLYGLRYGICTSSTVVTTGLDDRNWNFDGLRRAVGLADSVSPDRIWYLDGRRTVADLVRNNCVLDGVALGIRGGRVSPFALTPPMAADTPVATFTSSNRKLTWERNPDGIANVFEIETGNTRSVVNNQLSVARYGQGKAIKLRVDGSDDARLPSADPRELASSVLAHLNNFAEPTFVRKIRVPLRYATSVFIGDYIGVTDWLTPNGSGGRGPQGIVTQVIGREIDFAPGTDAGVTLEVLSYWQGLLDGIAPCCRVTSIAANTLSINVGYLAGTSSMSDYADSTGAAYPFLFGDGGASWFSVGDKVKLVRRGVTTVTEETGFTITSVTPGAGTSTIDVTPAPTTVVGGNVWDVVFDNYGNGASVADHEKKFAWTGDYTTDVIGTSTDTATRWSP